MCRCSLLVVHAGNCRMHTRLRYSVYAACNTLSDPNPAGFEMEPLISPGPLRAEHVFEPLSSTLTSTPNCDGRRAKNNMCTHTRVYPHMYSQYGTPSMPAEPSVCSNRSVECTQHGGTSFRSPPRKASEPQTATPMNRLQLYFLKTKYSKYFFLSFKGQHIIYLTSGLFTAGGCHGLVENTCF